MVHFPQNVCVGHSKRHQEALLLVCTPAGTSLGDMAWVAMSLWTSSANAKLRVCLWNVGRNIQGKHQLISLAHTEPSRVSDWKLKGPPFCGICPMTWKSAMQNDIFIPHNSERFPDESDEAGEPLKMSNHTRHNPTHAEGCGVGFWSYNHTRHPFWSWCWFLVLVLDLVFVLALGLGVGLDLGLWCPREVQTITRQARSPRLVQRPTTTQSNPASKKEKTRNYVQSRQKTCLKISSKVLW